MLLDCRQTQAGVLSNLLVASPFTGQLRNFSFAPCQPGDARQSEKPESSGPLAIQSASDLNRWQ